MNLENKLLILEILVISKIIKFILLEEKKEL